MAGVSALRGPEPPGRQLGALGQRAELRPHHGGVLPLVHGALGEAAVGARDHPISPDDTGEVHESFGDGFGMLDHRGRVRDHARDQDLVVGQLDVLPDPPLVRVARRRRFDGVGLGLDPQHEVDDVLQREIALVRALPASPAEVVAHPVLGDTGQRVVQRVDVHRLRLSIVPERGSGDDHVPRLAEAGVVDL